MNRTAVIILRWGLAFVFFYAAIASLINPQDWIGYVPEFVRGILPGNMFLTLFSIFEIVLASFLFIGKQVAVASIVAALALAGVTIMNFNQLDVLFRDVGLAMMALALFELVKKDGSANNSIDAET